MAFSAQMNNLKVNLGQSILPVVTSLLKRLNDGLSSLSAMVKKHQTLARDLIVGIGGPLAVGGMLAGGLFLARLAAFPFRLLKAVGSFAGWGLAGFGVGAYDAFGGKAMGDAMAGKISNMTKVVRGIGKVMGAVFRLGSALLLLDAVIGHENLKDIGSALWSDVTGDKKGSRAKWKSLDDRFKNWLDSIFGKENRAWNWVRNRVYGPDYNEKAAEMAASLSRHNLPALERWNSYLGYGNARGRPWHWEEGPPTWMPQFRGPGARGGPGSPVPVVITQMPKGQDRPNNVTTNVTVNVTTNASPQAIGGAVGSAVGSKVSNALSDQHH